MLELHTRQVYTVDATAIKRARKNEKEQLREDKAEVPPWGGQQWNYWGGGGGGASTRSLTNGRPDIFYQKRQSMCLNHLLCKLDIVHNLIRHHILKNLICLIRLNLRLPFHLYYRFNWLCKKSLKCLSNVMFQTTCFPSLKFLWRSLPKPSVW